MTTWQAILIHLALAAGAAIVPTIKDPMLKAAIGAVVAAGTAQAARVNSNTDPKGNKLSK